MNIMASLALFAVFVIAYSLIIEIFTVLFRLTGLTREKAKTQVISLLTTCGFTTAESEIILASKRRRKLAQVTMLCGCSFSVIIVSILVNVFLSLSRSEASSLLFSVGGLLLLLAAAFLLMRVKRIREKFDRLIEKLGNRFLFGRESNIVVLVDNYKSKAMVEVYLENIPAFLDGVRLADTRLREEYDIHLLVIQRGDETVSKIDANTLLLPHDTLVLFGNYKNIRSVFEHPGPFGRAADI